MQTDSPLRFISLFSGIEAASSAWLPLGWKCAAVAEVDGFCCQLLKRKYPDVPNLGDVTAVTEAQIKDLGPVDVVIFGSPCQDLSVAGKRAGLAGERSGLFFDAMRIVRWSGARFALWENVPGAFSSNAGADFAAVAGEMAGVCVDVPDGGWRNTGVLLGPAGLVEWTVLDAQWFGVPQRRRRIFALRDSGDWANRPPILFDAESLSGNSAPRRKTREGIAGTAFARSPGGGVEGYAIGPSGGGQVDVSCTLDARCKDGAIRNQLGMLAMQAIPIIEPGARTGASTTDVRAGSGIGENGDPMFTLQAGKQHGVFTSTGEISHCLNAGGMGRIDYETETFVVGALCSGGTKNGHGTAGVNDQAVMAGHVVPALVSNGDAHSGFRDADGLIAFDTTQITYAANGSNPQPGDPCHPIASQGHPPAIATREAVRRLTPRECERLQGFPDDCTLIQIRGKPAADGPRYKALGNSMAVPVISWIGERIAAHYPAELSKPR